MLYEPNPMKVLRQGRDQDVSQLDCLYMIVMFCAMLLAFFTFGTVIVALSQKLSIGWLFGVLAVALFLASSGFCIIYNRARSKIYYLADFPLERKHAWLMAVAMIGVFPILIYSYAELRKLRRYTQEAEVTGYQSTKTYLTTLKELPSADKFPLELPNVMQYYCSQLWQAGYAEQRKDKQSLLEDTLDKIDQYERALERFRKESDELREWLQNHPEEGAVPSDDDLGRINSVCGELTTNPDILKVTPKYQEGANLRCLHVVFAVPDPTRTFFLGAYSLELAPEWQASILNRLKDGRTINYRRERDIRGNDELNLDEFLERPDIEALMGKGEVAVMLYKLVEWIREQLLVGIDRANLDDYFSLTWYDIR